MYGPDLVDDDDDDGEEEDDFYDDFEIPIPIITTTPLDTPAADPLDGKPKRLDIKITLTKVEVILKRNLIYLNENKKKKLKMF